MFRPSDQHENVVLNFRRSPESEYGFYGRGFHEAAQKLVNDMWSRPHFNDLEALPIVFLYRHALELSTKAVILGANTVIALRGGGMSDDEIWRIVSGHRLVPLVPHLRRALKCLGWRWRHDQPEIRTLADVRAVFEDLEAVDPISFAFRYPTDKQGAGALPHHFAFSMSTFVSVIDPLVDTLQGYTLALEVEYDRTCEALSSAG